MAVAARNGWKATVTVTVHDESHQARRECNGEWHVEWRVYLRRFVHPTNASGQCSITTGNIGNKKASATLTITAVSHANFSYAAASNHDPETDSNGTAITVPKP